MIWNQSFTDRLRAWQRLRDDCADAELALALHQINRWWLKSPWTPYWLHWDDRADWPNPWQLLENNRLCSVARALGIMYTVILLDRSDLKDAEMIEVNDHNLVLVGGGKYILNWDSDQIVNNRLSETRVRYRLRQNELATNIL